MFRDGAGKLVKKMVMVVWKRELARNMSIVKEREAKDIREIKYILFGAGEGVK